MQSDNRYTKLAPHRRRPHFSHSSISIQCITSKLVTCNYFFPRGLENICQKAGRKNNYYVLEFPLIKAYVTV